MLELLRQALRSLRARPARSILALLGISAGVALFVAIEIINRSTLAYFSGGVAALSGKSQLTVTGAPAGFPAERLADMRGTAGVKHAVPLIELPAYALSTRGGPPGIVLVMGVDRESELLVRQYGLAAGAEPSSLLASLAERRSLLLAGGYARDEGLAEGTRLNLITQEGLHAFTVRGVLEPVGPAAAFGGKVAIMQLGDAQAAFGMEGKVTRVDIVVSDPQNVDTVADLLKKRLGPGFEVQRPESAAQGLRRMVAAYQALLAYLSTLAFLIGGLVLATTLAVLVTEHRRDLGILRAIGASRGAIFWLIEMQALVLGAVGAMLGIAAGIALAEGLVTQISRGLSNQYMLPIDVTELRYGLAQAAAHWAVATGFAMFVSAWAALRAGRVTPMEAIRHQEIAFGESGGRWIGVSGAFGAAVLAYLAFVLATGRAGGSAAWELGNALLGWLGALALAPWLVVTLIRFLGRLVGRQGIALVPGLGLALHSLGRRPRACGSNVLMLTIGLLLVVTVDAVHHSFRKNLEAWLDRILYADLVVSSAGRLMRLQVQPLREDLADALNAIEGVQVVDGYGAMGVRNVMMAYRGRQIALKAFDRPHPAMKALPFDFRDASALREDGDIFRRGEPAALVSDSFARNFGKRVGDRLTLPSPTGPVQLVILGEIVDYATPDGVVYLSRDLYKQHWQDSLVTFFAVMVSPGALPQQVQERIHAKLGLERGVYASLNDELRRQMHEVLDESFAYTRAIEGAALLVGLLGLTSAMASSVHARRREFGVLRAVGMPRAMLRNMVLSESLVQSALASVAASGLGLLLAYLCLVGVVSAATGWRMQFWAQPHALLGVATIGIACGTLAGLLPASYAARVEIAEALSYG